MNHRLLINSLIVITFLFWWAFLNNEFIIRMWIGYIPILIARHLNTAHTSLSNQIKTINTHYLTLPLIIILLRSIIQQISVGERSHIILGWTGLLIASVMLNTKLISEQTLVFGQRVMDIEDIAMLVSVLCGLRIVQTYWYMGTVRLYLAASVWAWLVFTIVHSLFYKNPKRLLTLPYFMILSIVSLSTLVWGIGSTIINKYADITLQKAKIIQAKEVLPTWFPPELWPKLMTGDSGQ